MKRYIIGMWLAVLPISFTLAQTDRTIVKNDEVQGSMNSMSAGEILPTDTTPTLSKRELRRERVAKRNLHYNILGGPSYTPDFGLLVGGSALMTFRMNPSDTTQRRSIVPMAIALMFKGGLNLMTKPQLFFKGDRFRIFGTFSYKNTIENFYGIGYSTNKDYPRGEDTSEYRYSGIQVNPWFLFRLGKSNFFAGPQIDLNYDKNFISTYFLDTIAMSNLYLAGLGGDYDGDQVTIKSVFSQEANAECERIMLSKSNLLNICGDNMRKTTNEGIQTIYMLTRFAED